MANAFCTEKCIKQFLPVFVFGGQENVVMLEGCYLEGSSLKLC